MTARQKTALFRRVPAASHRAAASSRRAVARKAPIKRRRNPSEEARREVASKWAAWGGEHHLTAAQIKQGLYVVGVMPDPTRIKDFSALAKMLGARGVNPMRRGAARKNPGFTVTARYAIVKRVGKGKYKFVGYYATKAVAVADANVMLSKMKTGELLVLTRAQFAAMKRAS